MPPIIIAQSGPKSWFEQLLKAAAAARILPNRQATQNILSVFAKKLVDDLRIHNKPAYNNIFKYSKSEKDFTDKLVGYIMKYSEEAGIDPLLAMAVLTMESRGDPDAGNHGSGCSGFFQLSSALRKEYNVGNDVWQNIRGGCQYLKWLMTTGNKTVKNPWFPDLPAENDINWRNLPSNTYNLLLSLAYYNSNHDSASNAIPSNIRDNNHSNYGETKSFVIQVTQITYWLRKAARTNSPAERKSYLNRAHSWIDKFK